MGKKLTKQNDDLDAFLTFLKTKYKAQLDHALNRRTKGVSSTPLAEPSRNDASHERMPSASDGSAKNSSE